VSCGGSHAEMFKFSAGQNFFEKASRAPSARWVALMRGTCCAARSKLNIQKSLWPASAQKNGPPVDVWRAVYRGRRQA